MAADAKHSTHSRCLGDAMKKRIVLIGCVKGKVGHEAPARDLYRSTLFTLRRRWAERHADTWLILSALHGVVEPTRVVAPYDVTLERMPARERREWSQRVLQELEKRLGSLAGLKVEIHAGREYFDHGLADGLRARRAHVEIPMAGKGIGSQLRAYKELLDGE